MGGFFVLVVVVLKIEYRVYIFVGGDDVMWMYFVYLCFVYE